MLTLCSELSVTEPNAGIPCRGSEGGGPPLATGCGAGEVDVCGDPTAASVAATGISGTLEAKAGLEATGAPCGPFDTLPKCIELGVGGCWPGGILNPFCCWLQELACD